MFTPEAIKELSKANAITNAYASIEGNTNALVALPSDFTTHDLERYNPTRRRARGLMTTSNMPDFAAYVEHHQEDGACIFIQQEKMTAIAVLNLGTPTDPGHADNTAILAPKKTAAYTALKSIATGTGCAQQKMAEFLEDWPAQIKCFNDAGAITAIRKITIENLKKLENSEAQLSASRSAFESVTATSTEPLPTTIYFKTVPYHGLQAREFVLRLGILSGGDKPAVNLRIINQEQHDEDMAIELADLVKNAVTDLPVLVGNYSACS
jgi:uncharacterized protein YfdQ (DUF2303 family)